MFTKPILSLTVLGALAAQVTAFWRLECNQRSGMGRIDPLVDAGKASAHAHTVTGGNKFSFNTKPQDLLASTCTSCSIQEDKSAYWTPILYFQHTDGTLEMVDQAMPFLAYYWLFGEDVHAFPQGFQMLAGDTKQREFPYPLTDGPKPWQGDLGSQKSLRAHAVGFNCLNYSPGYVPEQTLTRHFLPNKTFLDTTCKDGLKLELSFPSCWDGKDFDLSTQNDHLAYPDQVFTGNCPQGFDTRLVSLLYETKWATNDFKDKDGSFVFSNGDPTGFGYHGDFMAAWDDGVLDKAVKECTDESGEQTACGAFTIKQQQCTFDMPAEIASEDVKGPMKSLPGGVQIVSSGYASGQGANAGGKGPDASTATGSSSSASPSDLGDGSGKQQQDNGGGKSGSGSGSGYGSGQGGQGGQGGAFAEKQAGQPAGQQGGGSSSSSSSSTPTSTDAGTVTPPPKVDDVNKAAANNQVARTTYITKGQEVYEVLVVDEKVTVTARSTPSGGAAEQHARHKRAHDRHLRRHVHDTHARV